MSEQALLLRVDLHEPRYHGRPEWPPAPARVFQALVAAAGPRLREPEVQAAFRWLEALPPPVIAVPRHAEGAELLLFVPNNDLDAVGGDPERVAEIRAGKKVRPRLLDPDVPFLYAWPFDGADAPSDAHARVIGEIAAGLYQLGRGVDLAWARIEVLAPPELERRLDDHPGEVHRPTPGGDRPLLATPGPGTFDSLETRFEAQGARFRTEGTGRAASRVFVQPPKARFREVAYDSVPARFVFELRPPDAMDRFAPVALERSFGFVTRARDAAAARLTRGIGRPEDVQAVLVGRRPGESERLPSALRARLIPLPSIGHEEVDPRIRRLLVEVPQGGPLRAGDIRWAFSGLDVDGAVLVESQGDKVAGLFERPSTRWQTLTPAALPVTRRRLGDGESKDASERAREEAQAVEAVHQALRHAGVRARALQVAVQREAWLRKGARTEAFEGSPRFPTERLWHVEITFDRRVSGPLVLGDGRFLGLGVMAPARSPGSGTWAWRIRVGLERSADPLQVAAALRRAVMARAQAEWGARVRLPDWVTGHRSDGGPAVEHQHLYFTADLARGRLLVVDPGAREEPRLERALSGLTELRAGPAGRLVLVPERVDPADPLVAPATAWRSVTPYRVNRHAKRLGAAEVLVRDVRAACRERALPDPVHVEVSDLRAAPGTGLEGWVELRFAVAVSGPVLLGRTSHQGGGLFERVGGP